jgi:hypothetical protein
MSHQNTLHNKIRRYLNFNVPKTVLSHVSKIKPVLKDSDPMMKIKFMGNPELLGNKIHNSIRKR